MARITLHFPDDRFCYSTRLTVRVTDINAAQHLGNDSMISMISEARARFLFDHSIEEDRDDHVGIIVTDLATTYRAEAYARDELRGEKVSRDNLAALFTELALRLKGEFELPRKDK